jgi:prolyl-tRNA synthetase
MGAYFADEAGEDKLLIMGCYGWGITRSLAAAVEQRNDEHGIQWPVDIAPFEVAVLALGDSESVEECVQNVAGDLAAAGVEVVIDDRAERPGVKFAEADLVGWPYQVIVGERGLAGGVLEVKERASGNKRELPVDEVAAYLIQSLLAR